MMTNPDRFLGRVEEYVRYRMRFPAFVLEVLRERCGLRPEWVIADVGAGTGMLAELFLSAGNEVVAVEPNAEMRAACELLKPRFGGLRVVDAIAESTGLAAGSTDMVAVGRAFHWFDPARATAEFRRVLRLGGWLVLVSNRRAPEGSEAMRAYERVLREYGTGYAELHARTRGPEDLRAYGFVERFREDIGGEQRLTLEELWGQTQSYSVTPRAGEAGYLSMQEALSTYFACWSMEGAVSMKTVCHVAGWQVPTE